MNRRSVARSVMYSATVAGVLAGCCSMAPVPPAVAMPEPPPKTPSHAPKPDTQLAAFSADLVGTDRPPSGRTAGVGRLVAVYDPTTSLFRWKLAYSGIRGTPKVGQFRGSDRPGANPVTTLPFGAEIKSPMEGRANLSEAQAADLLSGKWYASIRTSARSRDEIRGQLVLHE